jgi:hypothetical protein
MTVLARGSSYLPGRQTNRDQPLLSSKRTSHFETHKWPWKEQKLVMGPEIKNCCAGWARLYQATLRYVFSGPGPLSAWVGLPFRVTSSRGEWSIVVRPPPRPTNMMAHFKTRKNVNKNTDMVTPKPWLTMRARASSNLPDRLSLQWFCVLCKLTGVLLFIIKAAVLEPTQCLSWFSLYHNRWLREYDGFL